MKQTWQQDGSEQHAVAENHEHAGVVQVVEYIDDGIDFFAAHHGDLVDEYQTCGSQLLGSQLLLDEDLQARRGENGVIIWNARRCVWIVLIFVQLRCHLWWRYWNHFGVHNDRLSWLRGTQSESGVRRPAADVSTCNFGENADGNAL